VRPLEHLICRRGIVFSPSVAPFFLLDTGNCGMHIESVSDANIQFRSLHNAQCILRKGYYQPEVIGVNGGIVRDRGRNESEATHLKSTSE
jgi:hypothetical protein